jgi:hypothetical protein
MRNLWAGALLMGGVSLSASAGPLIYDPFNYTPVGAELSTADGDAPEGWRKAVATTTTEPLIADGSLTYPGLPWSPSGNSVAMRGFTPDTQASSTRLIPGQPIQQTASGPTVYYSMLFRVNDVTGTIGTNGSFVAGLRSDSGSGGLPNNSNAGAPLLIRTGSVAGTYQLGTGLTANNADRMWTVENYNSGDTLLLVLSYQLVQGGEDFARLYVNPDPSLGEAANSAALRATGTATDGHGITNAQVSSVFLRNNGSAPDAFQVDEMRVATSWEDVMSIPEPTGLALLSLGGLALAKRRRR